MDGSGSNQAGTFSLIGFVQVMKGFYHQGSRVNTVNSLVRLTPVAGFSMNTDLHAINHGRGLSLMHSHAKRLVYCIMEHKKSIRLPIKSTS